MNNVLNELIPAYYQNKERLDNYKKLVDRQNREIKRIMEDDKVVEIEGYKATLSISKRVDVNEEKLIDVLKNNGITDAIKTKEYVDMDTLESLIYNNKINLDVLNLIGDCKSEKEVRTLRVTKN